MSDFKISGACTLCDETCFEVRMRYLEHERLPGEPKQIGGPREGAVRVTYRLLDGTMMDQTFCASCAEVVSNEEFVEIWRKNLRSWQRELEENRPDWFLKQFSNGLLYEMGRRNWMDIVNER